MANNNVTKKNATKKNQNGLGKAIPILLVLIMFSVGFYLMYQNMTTPKVSSETIDFEADVEHSQAYENIMNLDFVKAYPPGYLEVVEANNQIVMYQYGSEIKPEEAKDIIERQRQLFSVELLELNPIENQINGYLEEVNNFHEKNRYITSRKTISSELLAYEGDIANVTVDEQYSDGLGVQYTYSLLMQDGKWKIAYIERKVTTSVAVPEFNAESETEAK